MRKSQPRVLEPEVQLSRLHAKHAELDSMVSDLDSRAHLSAEEELQLHQLKKRKLQMKDEIEAVRTTREG